LRGLSGNGVLGGPVASFDELIAAALAAQSFSLLKTIQQIPVIARPYSNNSIPCQCGKFTVDNSV
jgi:hypothetical protein